MAIWQFKTEFMPDVLVPDAEPYIRAAITKDGFDTAHWWKQNQPGPKYGSIISQTFSPSGAWHKDLLRWGDEDDVLVEAWTEAGLVVSLSARVDLRHANRASFERLMSVAADLACHLYLYERQQVVPPVLDVFLPHVAESRAARFCHDPHRFLEELAPNSMGAKMSNTAWPLSRCADALPVVQPSKR